MSEPSVEEIVAGIERVIASKEGFVCLDPDWASAIVADWRKRGEALEAATIMARGIRENSTVDKIEGLDRWDALNDK
jgi:hypothetical protein